MVAWSKPIAFACLPPPPPRLSTLPPPPLVSAEEFVKAAKRNDGDDGWLAELVKVGAEKGRAAMNAVGWKIIELWTVMRLVEILLCPLKDFVDAVCAGLVRLAFQYSPALAAFFQADRPTPDQQS
ncbi:hypothetical protein N7462_000396 [Penicillium macrosclerotiorum]|uniref:uncharacterized protein n=1 Tax=Penicillium macrosclerotiorum TaxID=303699 RepID=UPI002547151E|nr:uncharacterized protein N7462_000396 [Penicillium macrosclerotiorum]KAJ5698391.1 hypothetical protein N7462_000396 [Penicillium macrosclerotiorum]